MLSVRVSLAVLVALVCVSAVAVSAAPKSSPASIVYWNNFYNTVDTTANFLPIAREYALTNVAVHDALNTIDPQYAFYSPAGAVSGVANAQSANPDAVVASVYYTCYTHFINTRKNSGSTAAAPTPAYAGAAKTVQLQKLQTAYDSFMDTLATNSNSKQAAVAKGIELGAAAANRMIAAQAADGWDQVAPVFAGEGNKQNPIPGKWYTDANVPAGALYPQWGQITPMGVSNIADFNSPPFLDITSQAFEEQLAFTKVFGRNSSTMRTEAQTAQARFWAGAAATVTLNRVYQVLLNEGQVKHSLHEATRVFALMSLALHNQGILNNNNKFLYNVWRPFQAIQNGGGSVNPRLVADPTWFGLLTPVNNPEYPAGHPMGSSAGAKVLRNLIGATPFATPITVNNVMSQAPNLPIAPFQVFKSFDDIVDNVIYGRIYGGLHLRSSGETGRDYGFMLADSITTNNLQPL